MKTNSLMELGWKIQLLVVVVGWLQILVKNDWDLFGFYYKNYYIILFLINTLHIFQQLHHYFSYQLNPPPPTTLSLTTSTITSTTTPTTRSPLPTSIPIYSPSISNTSFNHNHPLITSINSVGHLSIPNVNGGCSEKINFGLRCEIIRFIGRIKLSKYQNDLDIINRIKNVLTFKIKTSKIIRQKWLMWRLIRNRIERKRLIGIDKIGGLSNIDIPNINSLQLIKGQPPVGSKSGGQAVGTRDFKPNVNYNDFLFKKSSSKSYPIIIIIIIHNKTTIDGQIKQHQLFKQCSQSSYFVP